MKSENHPTKYMKKRYLRRETVENRSFDEMIIALTDVRFDTGIK
jgi:hypothetical protein